MTVVLDASVMLALFLKEPGSDKVMAALPGAVISTVNLAEVYTKSREKGLDAAEVKRLVGGLPIRIVPFDDAHAFITGELRAPTRQFGLSLGDRACLATARLERLPVLTTDRAWLKLGLDIEVQVIR
ncbi:type II toxin-antitoxin system VapC family toxin [Asticcacaulis sp. AC402]|uniref:type II toxin-antitoxin system VapC family toxin n=1 Tax=Asticcacaulis sp. AC402 TaxID=1282361 RepID=UPI0003C3C137|nr:type II toxin-antitoxin system VapC family toxin [Asticcacaulis sp. AC402]ESQ77557.1 hypothetical protein ABAC402_00075 [Asticcacaulis sp. AC402]